MCILIRFTCIELVGMAVASELCQGVCGPCCDVLLFRIWTDIDTLFPSYACYRWNDSHNYFVGVSPRLRCSEVSGCGILLCSWVVWRADLNADFGALDIQSQYMGR